MMTEVVFVCAHGNAKSLIASEWFNRLASERGIPAHATARWLTPENPVPPRIATRLQEEGMDVSGFEARAFVPADLDGAQRVVLIGVDPPSWAERSRVSPEAWNGIPPASEGYDKSRDAMLSRIEALLTELGSQPTR
jgi:arsenate reductase